jgi:predicted amidohydrolase
MMLVAGVVQMASTDDRERNLARAEELVRTTRAAGAELIALPEVFAWRGPPAREAEIAEPIPGRTVRRMAKLARELSVHLLLGSLLERSKEDARPFNTSVLLAPDGTIAATYRKIHLFDAVVDGHGPVRESATRAPGGEPVVATAHLRPDAEPIRLGLSVCYDLRFPELYRHLVHRGARVLLVPSAFTARTGRDHWLPLLTARAIENLAFVLAPDQWGPGRDGIETYGRSAIIDPWGTVLAVCPDGEGHATATVDLSRQDAIRQRFPALSHARADLFGAGPARER